MTRSSSSVISFHFLLFIVLAISIASCSGSSNKSSPPKENITLETPTKGDLDAVNQSGSMNLNAPAVEVPTGTITKLQEECDGSDNNNNKLYDEYCYSCCANAKKADFDCDGKVTMYDCNAPMLVAYSATILKGTNRACVDLNSDGVVNLSDTLACIDIVNAGGGK